MAISNKIINYHQATRPLMGIIDFISIFNLTFNRYFLNLNAVNLLLKMKKLLPFALILFAFISCKNDDEINVAACAEVNDVQLQSVGIDEVVIIWDDPNLNASFTVEYGPSGFIPGNGTFVDTVNREITIRGLDGNTQYDVYVQSICSINNTSLQSQVFSFITQPSRVIPEFTAKLSDMNIYLGEMAELNPSPYVFEYDLVTPLFTDYAHKDRLIALPQGEKMQYAGDGLPDFPDNTVITKTFFYNNDETDLSEGRRIIETRVLIKINGEWELGNYHWNAEQTDAFLNPESVTLPISYIDQSGVTQNLNYVIPGAADCFTCHNLYDQETPIGPKLRNMNFDGQLDSLVQDGHLEGLPDSSLVSQLPDWEDSSFGRQERARAYFDVNCAHCHQDGAFCEDLSTLRLLYETPFEDSNIYNQRFSILIRMQEYNPGFSMPWIGTTMLHTEGYELIESYLNSLD